MKNRLSLLAAAAAFAASPANAAQPVPLAAFDDALGGRMEASSEGETFALPLLRSEIAADLRGDLATVTVTQTFVNPGTEPVHATYLFPLHERSAVFEMTMEVADEIIRAEIQRVEEARTTFETAKSEGKSAALVTQHRPNVFTQDVANLVPGVPIRVALRYVQTVPKIDGSYELVVPLVVGPRFQPAGSGLAPGESPDLDLPEGRFAEGGIRSWEIASPPRLAGGAVRKDSRTSFGEWEVEELPAYPPVAGLDIPDEIEPDRVSIGIELDAGMPVRSIESPTHAIDAESLSPSRWSIRLARGRIIDNRDFVLRYEIAGEATQAGLLAHRDERGGFFSLLIEPPRAPADDIVTPREMVFLLDCSGSMAGLPIQASKEFMRRALHSLRPTDSFRVIRFSDRATEFSTSPLPATPANVARGIRYTNGLVGSGGTMMTSGIRQAVAPPIPDGALRVIVFLTDGYIGNELEVLRLLAASGGDARLYAFGVGTSVNRYLLQELGRVGRGFTRFMDPTEDVEDVATELSNRLESPILTDIEIDWGNLQPTDVTPEHLPDLFAGQSLRAQGRYAEPGTYEIVVRGLARGRPAALPLQVTFPEEPEGGDSIALVWARSTIADWMHTLSTPIAARPEGLTDDVVKESITQLGLEFALLTEWTAFVAVSERIYNPDPDSTATSPVPLPMVEGVTALAYGKPRFVGQATPEPEVMLALALAVFLSLPFVLRPAASRNER